MRIYDANSKRPFTPIFTPDIAIPRGEKFLEFKNLKISRDLLNNLKCV